MCSLFILQPNAVLYEVHTWELHSQVTEYESRFCTRMLSWGASDLWATWLPQFLAILTIHQVPGHHKEERKGGLSSLNIIRWQEKSGQRPGFSHTPRHLQYSCCQYLCAQGCQTPTFILNLVPFTAVLCVDRCFTTCKLTVLSAQSSYRVEKQIH